MEENKVEDKTEKTFKERYLAGEIEFEEIDRYISRWNNSDDERTLAVYLGLNADEEDVWIDESDIGMAVDANVIIFARIREEIASGKTVSTAIKTGFQKALSAI